MKSEHRHELKSNELAEWLGNLPEWFRDNLITIIILVVAIGLFAAFFGWRFYSKNIVQVGEDERFTTIVDNIMAVKSQIVSQQLASQSSDMSYMLLTQADDIEKFAAGAKNDNIAALAYVKAADSIRSELHYTLDAIDKDYLAEKINQAKALYNKAMEVNPANNTVKASATFGLGLCSEELGDFNDARKVYEAIVKNESFKGTIVVNKATLRLITMDDYKQPIEFKPAPKQLMPEPNMAIQPMIEMVPSGSNQPTEFNVPSEMNSTVPEANLPSGIILQRDENFPGHSFSIAEVNSLPSGINIPAEPNLPVDANEQK